ASPEAALHEMIICVHANSYIRPHRPRGRPEPLHVIAGVADLVSFDETGKRARAGTLGTGGSAVTAWFGQGGVGVDGEEGRGGGGARASAARVGSNGPWGAGVFRRRFRGAAEAWEGEMSGRLAAAQEPLEWATERFAPGGWRSVVLVSCVAGRWIAADQPAGY